MKDRLLKLIEQKPGQTTFELARAAGEDIETVARTLREMALENLIVRSHGRRGRLFHHYLVEKTE